jgi:hypothetical protein
LYVPEDGKRILNVWVPMTPCGKEAPSLEFVIVEPGVVREYSEYNPDLPFEADQFGRLNRFNRDVFEIEPMQERFERWRFWPPTFQLGDVILFSGWTLHRTFVEPGMKKTRISLG